MKATNRKMPARPIKPKLKRLPADYLDAMLAIVSFRRSYPKVATQAWLAGQLGMHVNTVARMERGEMAAGNLRMLQLALSALREVAEREVARLAAEMMQR